MTENNAEYCKLIESHHESKIYQQIDIENAHITGIIGMSGMERADIIFHESRKASSCKWNCHFRSLTGTSHHVMTTNNQK